MKAPTLLTVAAALLLLLSALGSSLAPAPVSASPGPGAEDPDRLAEREEVAVQEVVGQGDRSVLRVNNRSPFIVLLYIGGVRVGWMRPYRVALIRGLSSGYHKMYAHSQYGSTSWGPKEIWVPGTWNLLN